MCIFRRMYFLCAVPYVNYHVHLFNFVIYFRSKHILSKLTVQNTVNSRLSSSIYVILWYQRQCPTIPLMCVTSKNGQILTRPDKHTVIRRNKRNPFNNDQRNKKSRTRRLRGDNSYDTSTFWLKNEVYENLLSYIIIY